MNIQDMITETRPPTPDRWAEFEALMGSKGAPQGALGSPILPRFRPDSGVRRSAPPAPAGRWRGSRR